MKKRLFISTGLISLMNALTIIRMKDESCEDHLIIYSYRLSEQFIEQHRSLCKCHDFKEIYFAPHWNKADVEFDAFDEVYTVERVSNDDISCFKNKLFYFDEGINYIQTAGDARSDGTFYWEYVNKIVPYDETKNTPPRVEIFQSVISDVVKDTITIHSPERKRVLLMGENFDVTGFSREDKINTYKKVISMFIEKDFDIYLKPHPREDKSGYDELRACFSKNDLYFVDTSLPVELYNAEFTSVVGITCNSLFSLAHFYNVPTAHAIDIDFVRDVKYLPFIKNAFLISEYIPTVGHMLEAVDAAMNHDEAIEVLRKRFARHLESRVETRRNDTIRMIMRPQKTKCSYLRKVWINLQAAFIFERRKRKEFRKNNLRLAYGYRGSWSGNYEDLLNIYCEKYFFEK